MDKPSISSFPPQWAVKGPRNIGLGWCLRNASRKSWWVGWHCYLLVLLRLVRYSYEFSQTSRRMWRKNRSPCPTPFFSFLGLWKGNLLPWHVILTFLLMADLLSALIPQEPIWIEISPVPGEKEWEQGPGFKDPLCLFGKHILVRTTFCSNHNSLFHISSYLSYLRSCTSFRTRDQGNDGLSPPASEWYRGENILTARAFVSLFFLPFVNF